MQENFGLIFCSLVIVSGKTVSSRRKTHEKNTQNHTQCYSGQMRTKLRNGLRESIGDLQFSG